MKTYEITLKGFDGSTDETDDKILWFVCADSIQVDQTSSELIEYVKEIDVHQAPEGAIDLAFTVKKSFKSDEETH
jgi:hypothetical protein